MTGPSFIKGETVCFDVGGHHYTVSRSMIELYPNSMLARLVSRNWAQNKNRVIFIDRNGHRFQYVLDVMRDHEVNLPMTESKEAIKKELEYFGILDADNNGNQENISSKILSPKITLGTPAEVGDMLALISGNTHEVLDELREDIKDFKNKIKERTNQIEAVKMARNFFERSVAQQGNKLNSGDPFKIHISHEEELRSFQQASKVEAYFKEKLASYGLEAVSLPQVNIIFGPGAYDFEFRNVKRCSEGTGNADVSRKRKKTAREQPLRTNPLPVKKSRCTRKSGG